MKIDLNYIINNLNIGDTFFIKSNNDNFYSRGLYNGIPMKIIDKMTVYSPITFEETIAVIVEYQPMSYYIKDNAEYPTGKLATMPDGEPIIWQRKLNDTNNNLYWYEI